MQASLLQSRWLRHLCLVLLALSGAYMLVFSSAALAITLLLPQWSSFLATALMLVSAITLLLCRVYQENTPKLLMLSSHGNTATAQAKTQERMPRQTYTPTRDKKSDSTSEQQDTPDLPPLPQPTVLCSPELTFNSPELTFNSPGSTPSDSPALKRVYSPTPMSPFSLTPLPE